MASVTWTGLTQQLEQSKEKLSKLEMSMLDHPYNKVISDILSPKYGDYIVLKGAIIRERTYIDWLVECINEIEICSVNYSCFFN
ncbi:hypothetical protein [Alkalibaculum sporogenes]|uniref:hypothetical protein n=1 Tax=Alkalibaculum sporogenes TaxID=2655001 RepID=UPI0031B5B6B4